MAAQKSKSGKYRSIQHLIEAMLAKNPNLTTEGTIATVKAEYPGSSYLKNPTRYFAIMKFRATHRKTTAEPVAPIKKVSKPKVQKPKAQKKAKKTVKKAGKKKKAAKKK